MGPSAMILHQALELGEALLYFLTIHILSEPVSYTHLDVYKRQLLNQLQDKLK